MRRHRTGTRSAEARKVVMENAVSQNAISLWRRRRSTMAYALPCGGNTQGALCAAYVATPTVECQCCCSKLSAPRMRRRIFSGKFFERIGRFGMGCRAHGSGQSHGLRSGVRRLYSTIATSQFTAETGSLCVLSLRFLPTLEALTRMSFWPAAFSWPCTQCRFFGANLLQRI